MTQPVGWAELDLPLKLNIQAAHLSDEQFLQLCRENPDLRIEMNARGELVIMPPTGMKTGMRNHTLAIRLGLWNEQVGFGVAFDSSTMFTLPTDRLPVLQEERQEYIDNGARLGWLIDPIEKKVYVYRPSQPVEMLDDPATLSDDPTLSGFVLPVQELW